MPTLAQLALMARLNQAARGVEITVTPPAGSVNPPGGVPVETTGIWHVPLKEAMPTGQDRQRLEPRRVMEIPINAALPLVPRGSTVEGIDRDGAAVRTFRCEGLDRPGDPLRTYVVLVPVS
jgi:hypothetical protein